MNKEFRAFNVKTNKWVQNFKISPKGKTNKNLILIQYTGIKDVNKKKIFEGHIVQCNPEVKYYRQVFFHDGNYWFINPDNLMPFQIQVVSSSHPQTKIVGHIFENPELMKKQ
jgi:hypothetical protein